MKLKHIIESQQFERPWLMEELFPLADEMKKIVEKGGSNDLLGKGMITFFYEPSTRTRASFEIAMNTLGGKVIFSTENAKQFSSVSKGETIEDTIRVLCGYQPDVIVLRSDEEGMVKRATEVSSVPIINAGDGSSQHPTQALLDIYTIQKELGKIDGKSIAITGDLAHGRAVRSLSFLLGKFTGIKIYFVSPKILRMQDDVKEYLKQQNIWFAEETDLRRIASLVDVIYLTRIQKERGCPIKNYREAEGFYFVNQKIMNLIKREAIIMHVMPRVEEVAPEVDKDPRAAYFRQAENGLYIRMALLKMILA